MSRFQPRLKALATSNVSSYSVSTSNDPVPRAETPLYRQNTRLQSADPLSEKATLYLIRRTLCSQIVDKGRSTPAPIGELLPPLTSSNEVDQELYAFIAIIIREFVHVWYTKITPDYVFVEEVVKIIAHCTRALEQRLRKVDLEALLFDELPDLLEIHFQAHKAAHQKLHPTPFESDPRQIYHSLCPFPALSPVPDEKNKVDVESQKGNEAAYRQLLVQGVLAVLLPTEDLENDCLTSLVGQIFSEMILGGGIGGKASEPWLLWEGITKIAEAVQAKLPKSKAQVRLDKSDSDATASKPLDIIGRGTKTWRVGRSIQKSFWVVLQSVFLAFTAVRFMIITMATSSSLPPRIAPMRKITGSVVSKDDLEPPKDTNIRTILVDRLPLKQPILNMKIWSCVSCLLDLEFRMPWLSATISMLQWGVINGPGEFGNTDGMIDK